MEHQDVGIAEPKLSGEFCNDCGKSHFYKASTASIKRRAQLINPGLRVLSVSISQPKNEFCFGHRKSAKAIIYIYLKKEIYGGHFMGNGFPFLG